MCECCGQSSLEHLLADELIQSMMHADNVDPSSIRILVTAVALRCRPDAAASSAPPASIEGSCLPGADGKPWYAPGLAGGAREKRL